MEFDILQRKVKACPVVLRGSGAEREILVFRHPLAGVQLVKGTVEAGETIPAAALRELKEEAGIQAYRVMRNLGAWESGYEGQVWHFIECEVGDLPNEWAHFTQDDGGHMFSFYWHPIAKQPCSEWHEVFVKAVQTIQKRI